MEGYETVALIPFRSGGEIFGLIHVADHRENMVPPSVLKVLEKAAMQLGTAFQRARSESKLRESEEHYRSLFDNMLNGFAYCRMLFEQDRPQDFIYLDVNGAFETLTGLKDVVGKRVSEVIPGIRESDPGLLEIYGSVATTGVPTRFETYVEALEMWFSIAVYSPRKEHFVAVFDVITERKRTEEALRKSELLNRSLVEHLPQRIFIKDRQSVYLSCNELFAHDLGIEPEQVVGKDDFAFYPPELAEIYQADDRTVLASNQLRDTFAINN
jgi:PAS domain S-box-containing protein